MTKYSTGAMMIAHIFSKGPQGEMLQTLQTLQVRHLLRLCKFTCARRDDLNCPSRGGAPQRRVGHAQQGTQKKLARRRLFTVLLQLLPHLESNMFHKRLSKQWTRMTWMRTATGLPPSAMKIFTDSSAIASAMVNNDSQ